ncbi:MAG: EamA family transporter [Rhodospirillales bacterium]|nr:EamA family transporter [Rhodospirillales bacterium]
MPGSKVRVATAVGGTTILLWSTLAVLTTLSGSVPPLQLVAMAFALAASLAIGKWLVLGEPVVARLRWPVEVWLVGVGGLFGYHALYFLALRSAPAVEASLINYLWPLLIVLFSALLPGHRLRWWHVAGAVAGFAGTGILVGHGGDGGFAFRTQHLPGYLAALAAAVTWAGYSVLSRRYAHVPTDAVGGFCAGTALLAAVGHMLFEETVWPAGGEWLAVLAMGLGPVGIAFFTWDYGVKHGDIRALGVAGYATPLLSTLLLIGADQASLTPALAAGCILIVGGAVLAAREVIDGQ